MKRLSIENRNSAQEYDRIFKERQKREPDWMDLRRWKKLLSRFHSNFEAKLIDIGCLDSQIPQMAKKYYPQPEIWAVDIAKEVIEELNKKNSDINYQYGDIYSIGMPNDFFDYAVMGELLEHLEEPEKAIKETMRILKPKGILAVSVPYNETEVGEIDKDRHLWSFSADDIIGMLRPYGEVEIEILGSQFEPEYRYHFPYLLAWCKKYVFCGYPLAKNKKYSIS